MSRIKKWHEYPRVIPFDLHSCQIQQDAIYREHRIRKKWEDMYGKIAHLYWQNTLDVDADQSKVCSCSEEGNTSVVVNPPTINGNGRGLMEETASPDQYSKAEAGHKVHSSNDDILKDEGEFRNASPCFRTLKFPPKCDHICARMGFECWMCDEK
ncbi:uncharacterized protein [Parasteatoda tepidariorum]|uniref:uncharacterized protein n=1 Tax=Parasteatoda tepidariorum TaxID=114398 RepID=UPI001C71B56D|nr:uncharacterized protein LOC122270225 [Parasteatoda tepidariorum]